MKREIWSLFRLVSLGIFFGSLALPVFGDRVITLEGDILEGEVTAITESQEMVFAAGERWSLEKLRAIVPSTQVADVDPARYSVWLTNGSWFSSEILQLADETYRLRNPVLGELAVPIDLVWAVRLGAAETDSRFAQAVRVPTELREDVIYVSGTGTAELQEVNGLIELLDEQSLAFDTEGERKVLPAAQVHAVLLASPPFEAPLDDWITCRLTLSDGSLISGHILGLENEQLEIDLGEEVIIKLPWDQVRRMTVDSELLHYLSDLREAESSTEAIYALPRMWKRDVNVRGAPLRLGPNRFEKGLGVASGTSITFANDGGYTLFTATIGLDALSGLGGDAEFVVRGDREEIFRQRMGAGEPGAFIRLEVERYRKITLSVEPGILGLDLNDDANWCEACFLQLE